MKLLIASIFLSLLLSQVFGKWIIIAGYEANKEVIAATICENKEKVELKCKGKCQLKKKLSAEENDNQAPQNNSGKIKIPEINYLPDISVSYPGVISKDHSIMNGKYNYPVYTSPHFDIFHPPV
ncbi:MAG TPA: hypothetical protein VGD33_03635 [Chitinophagaceae bacterium]